MDWFNTARAHSRLNGVTPQQAYLDLASKLEEAALNEIRGVPRVVHRGGRFVASADRRRGQLCT